MSCSNPTRGLAGLLAAMLLVSCVEHPPHRQERTEAQLKSWMKILEVDGHVPENAYQVTLATGQHRVKVLYETYQYNYLCHFEFSAQGGYSYEVVDHSNPQPLVIYRWRRANGLWAERLEPIMPQCEEISRSESS